MKQYRPLVVAAILCLLAVASFYRWLHRKEHNAGLEQARSLVAHQHATAAWLEDFYAVNTMYQNNVPVDSNYDYQYAYHVNGITYTGKYSTHKRWQAPAMTVYYDETAPWISTRDPKQYLQEQEAKAGDHGPLYLSLLLAGIAAVLCLQFRQRRIDAQRKAALAQTPLLWPGQDTFMYN